MLSIGIFLDPEQLQIVRIKLGCQQIRHGFPADSTEVRITVFMKEAATVDPTSRNTIVNGEVVVLLLERLG